MRAKEEDTTGARLADLSPEASAKEEASGEAQVSPWSFINTWP